MPFQNIEGRNDRQGEFEIPMMIRLLGLPRRARLLEIGCGRGIGLREFARRLEPSRLVGLDIDQELLDDAGRRLGEAGVSAELYRGDARAMPFPDSSFDLVIDFGTCFHIGHPERALNEVERVLGPTGRFVHETRISQLLSHPVRSFGRVIPFHGAPGLPLARWGLLWTVRRKRVGARVPGS